MTLNVTAYISDEIGDLWFYCATTGYEWYVWGGDYIKTFEGDDTYGWPISAL